jgi:serine/threonine protein kinase
MSSVPNTPESPAFDLVGQTIADGWLVEKRLPRAGEPGAEDLTGSYFSIGYIATKGNKKAFVKALDVQGVITDRSSGLRIVDRLKQMTDRHTFESVILDICKKARLDRIVELIATDDITLPNAPLGIEVPYIMFELADGDVRNVIGRSNLIDDAWRFRILHDVAVGIQQLHRNDISHQDIKPSNVLVFSQGPAKAKLGDLGRCSRRGMQAEHDGSDIPGAVRYAPPEQVFGIRPERWEDRREGCDVYHLGSLTAYLFSGVVLSVHLAQELPVDMRPSVWGGKGGCDYETALPSLSTALTDFVRRAGPDFPTWAADELSQIILSACNPDYRLRGDPAARRRTGSPVGIDTYVSRFDRLAKQANVKIRRA